MGQDSSSFKTVEVSPQTTTIIIKLIEPETSHQALQEIFAIPNLAEVVIGVLPILQHVQEPIERELEQYIRDKLLSRLPSLKKEGTLFYINKVKVTKKGSNDERADRVLDYILTVLVEHCKAQQWPIETQEVTNMSSPRGLDDFYILQAIEAGIRNLDLKIASYASAKELTSALQTLNIPAPLSLVADTTFAPPFLYVPVSLHVKEHLEAQSLKKETLRRLISEMVSGLHYNTYEDEFNRIKQSVSPTLVEILSKGIASPTLPTPNLQLEWPKVGTIRCIPWRFTQIDNAYVPIVSRSVGTSYRGTSSRDSIQLFNTYTQLHKSNHIVRHSVIDSGDRMEMLLELLKVLPEAVPGVSPIKRVRMLNLLTRKGNKKEEVLWQNQWVQVQKLSQEIHKLGGEVAYINLQSNANTELNFFNHGEEANSIRSVQGYLQYLMWLLEDSLSLLGSGESSSPTTMNASTVAVDNNMVQHAVLGRIRSRILGIWDTATTHTEETYGSLWFTRKGWTSPHNNLYSVLREMISEDLPCLEKCLVHSVDTNENRPRLNELITATKLLHRLLESQYMSDISKPLTRTEDFLILAMLDRILKVTSCMNCKSGCDRTGFVHSLTTALYMVIDSHPNKLDSVAKVCLTFDSLRREIDGYTENLAQYLKQSMDWMSKDDPTSQALSIAILLRNCILITMLQISWKINLYSTGLTGLKWHLGTIKANPHITPTLPPFAIALNPTTTILEVHKKGKIDSTFASFLNGGSNFRGD